MTTAPTAVQPLPRGSLSQSVGRSARDWAPAALIFVIGIAAWEGLVRGLDVERFLLPPLSAILQTFWEQRDTFVSAGLFTFKEALGGFLLGIGRGLRRRARARALAPARQRSDALRHRGERDPDHRLRADHQQLVRDPVAGLEDRDRGRDLLLPGDDQHAARPDIGAARRRSS